jgi:hypothetical protein
MMSSKTPKSTPKTVERRGFFATLGLGGAAAVVALVAEPEPAEAYTPPASKGGAHYRESEHVRQYYRVNRY